MAFPRTERVEDPLELAGVASVGIAHDGEALEPGGVLGEEEVWAGMTTTIGVQGGTGFKVHPVGLVALVGNGVLVEETGHLGLAV